MQIVSHFQIEHSYTLRDPVADLQNIQNQVLWWLLYFLKISSKIFESGIRKHKKRTYDVTFI
jgi:hypothetical protein